jgi:hypothetical protein
MELIKSIQDKPDPAFQWPFLIVWSSDIQMGCRGTLGCRRGVSGVPPNFELRPSYLCFTTRGATNCHFSPSKCTAKSFKSLKCAMNQQMLKTLI